MSMRIWSLTTIAKNAYIQKSVYVAGGVNNESQIL